MRKLFTIFLLVFSLSSYGQKGRWNSFKLLVIQPDTAIVDQSLFGDRDSIEANNLESRHLRFTLQSIRMILL